MSSGISSIPRAEPSTPSRPSSTSRSATAMRRAGVALVVGGVIVRPALLRLAHWRALVNERRATMWLELEQPGVFSELLGFTLLVGAQHQESRAQNRRGGNPPTARRGTPAG